MLQAFYGEPRISFCQDSISYCDADLDHVVKRLVSGAYYQSGQSCISVQRIIAHADVYPALRRKLKAAVAKLRMGDPREARTFVGPVIDEASAKLKGGDRDGALAALA